MERRCPTCGLSCVDESRCPLCDTSLTRVNLRRFLMWALVVEEYLVVMVVLLRFR